MRVTINSSTSGNYSREVINGRNHIVTKMVSIVGDSVMNRGLYPDSVVNASFEQLNMLPAPNGHPKINGEPTSAFHPCAVNACNIGAFIRNPVKSEKQVINDLCIDVEVANGSDDGIELMRRIENAEQVGVSTGIHMTQSQVKGTLGGKDYDWEANSMRFDHVAILLNEKPAGDETYLINEADLVVCDVENAGFSVKTTKEQLSNLLNELQIWTWIVDCVIIDARSGFAIYKTDDALLQRSFEVSDNGTVTLADDTVKVRRQVDYIELVSGDVTNNLKSKSDKEDIAMAEKAEQKVTTNSDLTVEDAIKFLDTKGLVVVNKERSDQLDGLIANQDKINSLLANEEVRLGDMRKSIVENSELSEADVASMGEETLTRLSSSFAPQNSVNNQLRNGGFSGNLQVNTDLSEESYAPVYDKEAS